MKKRGRPKGLPKTGGRKKGSKDKGKRVYTQNPDVQRRSFNLGLGHVPQEPQTRFHAINQLERIAQYWLARANEEDLKRIAEDEKFDEPRLNFALARAQSALATLAPYRHPRMTNMPEPLDLTRLNREELGTFRALFIKAMGPTTSEQQGSKGPKN